MTELWGGGVPSLSQGLLQFYTLLLIVIYFYPDSPYTLVPTFATTWVRSPTRVSPISIPASRLPALLLRIPIDPTMWLSLPVASSSLLPAIFLPVSPYVASPSPFGATMPLSCVLPPLIPSILRTLQISVATPPTVPQLPVFSLCRSSSTAFPPLLTLLPPRASPMSCQLTVVLASPWSV